MSDPIYILRWLDVDDADNYPQVQHTYRENVDPYSCDYGYCDMCGMELYAVDFYSVNVHSNAIINRPSIDIDDWTSWRNANLQGGE